MDREEVKLELIKRYKYLYVNSEFVLAPYMCEQTLEDLKKLNKKNRKDFKKYYEEWKRDSIIYLKNLDDELLFMLEEFLLIDVSMEETLFYKRVESLKEDKDYLDSVLNGLLRLKKKNDDIAEVLKEKLDFWRLLTCVRSYIVEQSVDLNNRYLKLQALEEYFRINRYSNDGKVWYSGYELSIQDIKNVSSYSYPALVSFSMHNFSRDKSDVGVINNSFINILGTDLRLSEKEKQEIYLEFHDELPWNLLIKCELEDLVSERLVRLENTSPCGCEFNVIEDEIFVCDKGNYYHLCPRCGYIVKVSEELLSVGVKKRIEERCNKDPNLLRKMILYSELKKLDDVPVMGKKKLLVK